MRARMALHSSQITCLLREVVLREKPAPMLEISPKGTVPVLQIDGTHVLEESLDIMLWALEQNDPENWLGEEPTLPQMKALIADTQLQFKDHLDRYKYPGRYENVDPLFHRSEAMKFIARLDDQIGPKEFLFANKPMLADIAIFPFIRQFANNDRDWFDAQQNIKSSQDWLTRCLALPVFNEIMEKHTQWQEGDAEVLFGANSN